MTNDVGVASMDQSAGASPSSGGAVAGPSHRAFSVGSSPQVGTEREADEQEGEEDIEADEHRNDGDGDGGDEDEENQNAEVRSTRYLFASPDSCTYVGAPDGVPDPPTHHRAGQ